MQKVVSVTTVTKFIYSSTVFNFDTHFSALVFPFYNHF